MPFSEAIIRRALNQRAQKARPRGEVQDNRFPVRPAGTADLDFRNDPLFEDITDESLIGWGTIGGMTT